MVLQCGVGLAFTYSRGMTQEARNALTKALMLSEALGDFNHRFRALYGMPIAFLLVPQVMTFLIHVLLKTPRTPEQPVVESGEKMLMPCDEAGIMYIQRRIHPRCHMFCNGVIGWLVDVHIEQSAKSLQLIRV